MLTKPQYTTLKAYINTRPEMVAQTVANEWRELAATLNAQVVPDFWLWRTDCPVDEIFDAITGANLTPTDAPDLTTAWSNRATACQGKQASLMMLLSCKDTVNATKASQRGWLQDALTGLPAGVGGAMVGAGWPNVRNVLKRTASLIEKVYSVGAGTSANPANPTAQGIIQPDSVRTAYLEG